MDKNDNLPVYDFGMRLKELRVRKGFSQSTVANRLGVSVKTIYRYENNTLSPSLGTVKQIALLYNTSIDYIMGLEDDPVISVRNLTDEEKRILLDFVRCFIDRNTGR